MTAICMLLLFFIIIIIIITVTFFLPISKKATQPTDQERKLLAEYLEPVSLRIYPLVVGKLPSLSKLPPRTDVHEWLATNCELHTLLDATYY